MSVMCIFFIEPINSLTDVVVIRKNAAMTQGVNLVMIADTCSIELISGKGEAIMTAPLLCDYNLNKMLITADERTFIKSLTVTELIPR